MGRNDKDPFDHMAYPPGSLEATRRDLYPNMHAKTRRQRTHIMSPSMAFKTDLPEDEAFLKLIKVLNKMDYCWLYRYSGPDVGVTLSRGKVLDLNKLITAFQTVPIKSLPLTGIKAFIMHNDDERIRAIVKVNAIGRTKVKLKIKGTIRFSEWRKLHTKVDRKLDADE
jgi:hypothetical protein